MNVAHYIAQRARALGLDPNAVLAVARQEGLSGGVGDHGTSFGPFQLHIGGAMPRGIRNPQAWAESPAGINYALSRINSVAHGLRGRQAIENIVSRFERPANVAGEVAGALADYGKGGSSPALRMSQIISGHGGGGGLGAMNPRQMLSQFMLEQAQAELGGSGTNPVAAEGTGLLQLAMARKALQAAASAPRASAGMGRARGSLGNGGYSSSPGSYSNIRALPGVNIAKVDPRLLNAINRVAKSHGVVVTINSGYRTPQHSVAVGGFANDPHTRGVAVDAYVNGKPIGQVFGPGVWSSLGVTSGDVPNFYNGRPDPEHLQIG